MLLRRARLRLALQAVTERDAVFSAAYEHSPQRFEVKLPLAVLRSLDAHDASFANWVRRAWHGAGGQGAAAGRAGSPAPGTARRRQPDAAHDGPPSSDHWVNLWRWSPQPDALAQLQACAAELRAGRAVDLAAPDLRKILGALPRGTQLPGWAKPRSSMRCTTTPTTPSAR